MNNPSNDNPVIHEAAVPSITAPIEQVETLGEPVTKAKSKTNINKAGIYIMGSIFAIVMLMFIIQSLKGKKEPVETKLKAPAAFSVKNEVVDSESIKKKQADILKADALAKAETEAAEAQKKAEAEAVAAAVTANAPATSNVAGTPTGGQATATGKPVDRPPTPYQRKMTGEVFFDLAKDAKNPIAVAEPVKASNSDFSLAGNQNQNNNGGIAANLQPTVLTGRNAGRLRNLDYLLKRGTSIPCALKTGIDTTLSGFVICNVVNDVYSGNGHTLLVERGATVFGEQQSTAKQGQARTFVLWTRIDNPSGVYANLDSPATDMMGFNGVSGYVDTHFWERFGGAIMISLIKDFAQVAVNKSSPSTGNNSPTFSNSSKASEDLAVETLKNSINIPPTLIVNPATVVNVLVARDVSFESVYTVVK